MQLGTHNSAISLADGYGNLDDYFKGALLLVGEPGQVHRGGEGPTTIHLPPLYVGFFKYIKWALPGFADAPLHTNSQLLSLTDQLRLGVRALELDTHWVGGSCWH